MTYYEILGVKQTDSKETISKAYKKLIRQYHPDVYKGDDKAFAEAKIREINAAYDVLQFDDKRRAYDLTLPTYQTASNTYHHYNSYTPPAEKTRTYDSSFHEKYTQWQRDNGKRSDLSPDEKYQEILKNKKYNPPPQNSSNTEKNTSSANTYSDDFDFEYLKKSIKEEVEIFKLTKHFAEKGISILIFFILPLIVFSMPLWYKDNQQDKDNPLTETVHLSDLEKYSENNLIELFSQDDAYKFLENYTYFLKHTDIPLNTQLPEIIVFNRDYTVLDAIRINPADRFSMYKDKISGLVSIIHNYEILDFEFIYNDLLAENENTIPKEIYIKIEPKK